MCPGWPHSDHHRSLRVTRKPVIKATTAKMPLLLHQSINIMTQEDNNSH
jgi:hypothetical protein